MKSTKRTAKNTGITLVKSAFQKTSENVVRTVNDQFGIVNEEFLARAGARKLSNPAEFSIDKFYADNEIANDVLTACYQTVKSVSSEGVVTYSTDKANKIITDLIAKLVTIGGIRNQTTFDKYLRLFNGDLHLMANEAIAFSEPMALVKSLVTCGLLEPNKADKARKNVTGIFGRKNGASLAIASVYTAGAGRTLTTDQIATVKKAMKTWSKLSSLARATKGLAIEQPAPELLTWKSALVVLDAPVKKSAKKAA